MTLTVDIHSTDLSAAPQPQCPWTPTLYTCVNPPPTPTPSPAIKSLGGKHGRPWLDDFCMCSLKSSFSAQTRVSTLCHYGGCCHGDAHVCQDYVTYGQKCAGGIIPLSSAATAFCSSSWRQTANSTKIYPPSQRCPWLYSTLGPNWTLWWMKVWRVYWRPEAGKSRLDKRGSI